MPETPAPRREQAAGVTARELLARRRLSHTLTAKDLETWMLREGLATNGDGRLRPTTRAVELAGPLRRLG